MQTIIEYDDAVIRVEDLGGGTNRVTIEMSDPGNYCERSKWETRYPLELIRAILQVKGPSYLCDEIARDEDPLYVQNDLNTLLFSYVERGAFQDKRVLDFGCGCGSSTAIIARMFPKVCLFGVELEERFLDVARLRTEYYGPRNVTLLHSPNPNTLPQEVGEVDYVMLSGVYEHLLPAERPHLLAQIWDRLVPGGIMFISQTPDRRFPIETHTTRLPLINYLPDRIAQFATFRFSRKAQRTDSWESLLRSGIRGATPNEIIRILSRSPFPPVVLRPCGNKIRRQSDIWYRAAEPRLSKRFGGARKAIVLAINFLVWVGIGVAPYLSLAVRKSQRRI